MGIAARIAAVVAAAAGAVFVAILAAIAFLHTPWGTSRLVRAAEEQASARMEGTFRIGDLRLGRIGEFEAFHVLVLGPDGSPAIAVREVVLRIDPLELLRGRLRIEALRLEGARVELAPSPEGGLVLSRAFHPTRTSAKAAARRTEPLPPTPPLPTILESLHVDGAVRVAKTPGGEATALVRDVSLDSSGAWRGHRARLSLAATGEVEKPLRRPLAIGIVARLEDGLLTAEPVDVRLGETRLFATGSGRPMERTGDLHIRGGVEARTARHFGFPLAGDVAFEGDVHQRGRRTELDLRASHAGSGEVKIAGSLDDPSKDVDLRLHLAEVDPSGWIVSAPKGSLTGDATVKGPLQPTDLRASVELEPGLLGGAPLGPVSIEGRIHAPQGAKPRVEVGHAQVHLPGATVQGRGSLSSAAVDAHLEIELSNLGEIRHWLATSFGMVLPPVDATGTLALDAVGPRRDLRFHLVADLDEVRSPQVDARRVHLEADGAAGEGGWPSGRATMRVAELHFGDIEFDRLTLSADRDPEGAFALFVQTARSNDRRAGAALCADGVARPGFLKIDVGRAALRSGDVDIEARGGAVIADGRVTGTLEAAAGEVGIVHAAYDGPIDPLRAKASAPIALEILAAPIDLGGLARITGRSLPAGRVRGRLLASGTIGEPDLELDARGAGIRFARLPRLGPLDLRAIVRHRAEAGRWPRGDVEAAIDAWIGERRILELAAGAPLDLGALRESAREEIDRMLQSRRSRIAGEMMGVDLASVGDAIGRPDLRGAAAATIDLRGPLRDPRGTLSVELLGGPLGPVREVHAAAQAILRDDRIEIEAKIAAQEDAGARARISLELGASVAQLLSRDVPATTPLAASIELRSIDLGNLTSDRSEGDGRLAGVLTGTASFTGTVADPCGNGLFRASGLAAHGAELGDVELSLALDAARFEARLHAIDAGGGTLVAGIDLAGNLERIIEGGGSALATVPTNFRLEATGLSLSPIGRALGVSYLGGTLEASLEARAPLREIEPVGAITVREGTIELPGGAIYDRIAVRIVFRDDVIEFPILDLHGRMGGEFFASGRVGGSGLRPVPSILAAVFPVLGIADGVGAVPFAFDLRTDLLPISSPGGPLGKVSLRDKLEGTIGPTAGVDATLAITSAHLELSPRPPRPLQPVGPLPDVVFVPGTSKAGPANRARRVLPLQLHVIAPGDVLITGTDVVIEAQADLHVRRAADGALSATGSARTTSGEVKVLGRTFVVENAELRWTGGLPQDPHIGATARHDAAQATAWADVGGTVKNPSIHLRSEPPLSESQIVMLVVSGRTQTPGVMPLEPEPMGRESQAGQGAAASLAGAAVTQKLRQALGPAVPIQILTSQTSTGQTVVEAGTYVGKNLYVGFVRNFLAEPEENTIEVRAQYELSRTVGLQTRFGDAGSGGVDVLWEKQIATPAQQRARKEARQPQPPPAPPGGQPPSIGVPAD